MPSTPQTITTQIVFDYLTDTAGKAISNAKVTSTLNLAGVSNQSPVVNIGPLQQTTATDTNGYWQFNLIPNPALTPAGTSYTIETPYNSYSISVPNSAGPFQSSSILVNVPSVISPAVTGLTGPITVTGNETVTGNLTVQGTTTLAGVNTGSIAATANSSIAGDLTILSPGRLLFTASAGKIVPGATSISHRNNADSADNLLITDVGNATVRGNLTLNAAPSSIFMQGAGMADIIGGTTGLTVSNNANNANNIALTDAGLLTLRNALVIPPSAGGTSAPTGYGSVQLKLAETILGGTSATITFSSIPTTFRSLVLDWAFPVTNIAGASTVAIQFNGDNGANYAYQVTDSLNAAISGSLATAQAGIRIGIAPGTSSSASAITSGRTVIPIANGSQRKQAHSQSYREDNGGTGTEWCDGVWSGTGAITQILLFVSGATFSAGSSVVLKGEP